MATIKPGLFPGFIVIKRVRQMWSFQPFKNPK